LSLAGQRSQELPSVYLRPAEAEARRELISTRALLVENRTRLALNLKSALRGRLIHIKGRANPALFTAVIRKAFTDDVLGLSAGHAALLQSYDDTTAQIKSLDEEIQKIAKDDSTCQRLMTVPGVGPQVSLAFCSHITEPTRFENADELGIIHAGPGRIKALLIQAAWSMWRVRPNDPMVQWARALAERRGKRIAIVALARKIAVTLWAMWKHGADYCPDRAARALSTEQKSQLPAVPMRRAKKAAV
jgi:transposase